MAHDKTKDLGAISVVVDPGKNPEGAIRKFKRICDNFGVVRELRSRQHHVKRSVAKREKRKAAEKRRVKEARKLNYEYRKI